MTNPAREFIEFWIENSVRAEVGNLSAHVSVKLAAANKLDSDRRA
ncbi:MAG TPA: hypothetical protein VID30_00745 [Bradyrhizobium sp.]|jgi:hypothetical protein